MGIDRDKAINDLYEAAAEAWFASLSAPERIRWLEAAAADGRERSVLAAFLLAGDIETGYVPEIRGWGYEPQ